MLISVVLTLMVVFAVVRIFDLLGSNVTDSRAILEMSARLRTVMIQLQRDLDQMTIPVRPWMDPGAGPGYFQIIEGPASDTQMQVLMLMQRQPPSFVFGHYLGPLESVIDPTGRPAADASLFGDTDDVLAFTIRSDDKHPFVGRFNGQLIQSRFAEVIWWVRQYHDSASQGEPWIPNARNRKPTSVRVLERRLLLIRPDLNESPVSAVVLRSPGLTLLEFLQQNDVSVRLRRNPDGTLAGGLTANSLADLTNRQNRVLHDLDEVAVPQYPHPFLYHKLAQPPVIDPNSPGNLDQRNPLEKTFLDATGRVVASGEQIVLSDVLAFDVRVFDPHAVVQTNTNQPFAVVPGDPGYDVNLGAAGPNVRLPRGAFVDLYYQWSLPPQQRYGFGQWPYLKSQLGPAYSLPQTDKPPDEYPYRTYCTWCREYEHDGIDQDLDGENGSPQIGRFKVADLQDNNGNGMVDELIDEGTNGIDDDGANGVDDPNEWETSPPYPIPLRGIEITMRVIDISSRQVRQASLVADVMPE